ncbi:MAG: CPBP family intramembrane metalloprotease [Clostridia bacterium]|nr:CPBP family intramembrane metalloprotease [Clostridia bacterium]
MKKRVSISPKGIYIILSVTLLAIVVCLIDALLHPPYFSKIPIKILFFLLIPLSYFLVNRKDLGQFKALFTFKRKGLFKALLLGSGIYLFIVGGFFLTRGFIDFSGVTKSLTQGMGITAENFVYVSLYLSLMNSFLEEFFFRGYGFITLQKYTGKGFAYLFSSFVFALYHVGMMLGMFHPAVLLLLLLGLIIGGCIFSYLNDKDGNIYTSWFVHMFANFAINTVGFVLFGIL